MKLTTFILLGILCTCSIGCSVDKSEGSGLPVIDISKEYPIEKLDIREIADVEYIPLETTEESVLFGGWVSMSDEYIVINDKSIYFFDRKTGKFLWKFNRQGGSQEEYASAIVSLVVDFDAEECYVYTRNKIYVYTYRGDFKRSFPIKCGKEFSLGLVYDYDKDFLIGYNNFSYHKDSKLLDSHPYYLISKKDGKVTPLPIKVKDPINRRLRPIGTDGNMSSPVYLFEMINLLKNGDDVFIGDFALDTLYTTKDYKLTPVAVQKPSVFSSAVPLVLSVDLFTDSYMGFYVIKPRYVPEDSYRPIEEAPYLYWNRKTGKIHRYELYDSNILTEKVYHPWMHEMHLIKNYGVSRLKAEFLVEQYEAGKLQGELKEIASKMDIEDNYVLVLYKFK